MAEQAQNEEFQSLSIGERLRNAREAKALSLEDLATQTRIPMRHLQNIEREEWDALPAATYCVGFVRSYANAVGLDGAEYGRELRDRLGGFKTRAPAPEYFQPADPSRVPPRSLALVAAVIAIILIIGYMFWRSSLDEEAAAPSSVDTPVAEAPAQPTRPVQARPAPVALAGQAVTLTATEDVWVRIEDAAGGTTLFEGIMAPGQRFQVPSTAQRPVIRTGRPQVLQISVGQSVLGPLEPVERTVSDLSLRAEDLASRLGPTAAAPAGAPMR